MTWNIDLKNAFIPYGGLRQIYDAAFPEARGVAYSSPRKPVPIRCPGILRRKAFSPPCVSVEFRMIDLPLPLRGLPSSSEWFYVDLGLPFSIIPIAKWNQMGLGLSHPAAQKVGYLRPTTIELVEAGKTEIADAMDGQNQSPAIFHLRGYCGKGVHVPHCGGPAF